MDFNFLHDSINFYAKKSPNKTALVFENCEITYEKLWHTITLLSHWLTNKLPAKSRIGVILDNCIETVYAIYAIPLSNMIAVPIDTNITKKNLDHLTNDCQISLIITRRSTLKRLRDTGFKKNTKVLLIDSKGNEEDQTLSYDEIKNYKIENNPPHLVLTDTAVILYTTGTTGLPKGVELTHFNLMSAVKNINEFMQIGDWAVESLPMPLSHSFGFARLRCVLSVGGTLILEKGLIRPEKVISNMKKYLANGLALVPAGVAIFLDHYKSYFKEVSVSLRYIEIGSAPMSLKHKKTLMELCPGARICMHYGLTEASRAAFIEFHADKNFLQATGKPSPNVEIKITDKTGNNTRVGEVGEILVKGNMVMKGYWNNPEATNDALRDDWLHTGDLGKFDSNGYLYFLGREDEIINIGGLKVSPNEIEEILLKYKGIKDVAVVGIKSKGNSFVDLIKAFLVLDGSTTSFNFKEIREYCLMELEPYKIPSSFEIVSKIPKTQSGKIKRQLLVE